MSKIFNKRAVMAIILATAASAASADTKTEKGSKRQQDSGNQAYVSKLVNNNKILSEKGVNSIEKSDILSIHVSNDTFLLKLKKESVIRLDEDRSNHVGKAKNKK